MKAKFKEKLAYGFDNFMAKGPSSIFLALLIVFISGFIILGAIRVVVGFYVPDDANTELEIWRIFLQLTDPGNMAQDNDLVWYMKTFSIIAGMFGIIFFSAVIAFITTQLDLKLADLKKGRSRVLEKNHVLILGWSNEIVDIIRELIVANESEKKASIVVLSDVVKEEMDDYLNEQVDVRLTTKIITRTGHTGSINALNRVSVTDAKSVIILPTCTYGANDEDKAHSDAHSLKALLAVLAACQEEDEKPSVVVQVYNDSNRIVINRLNPEMITIVDPEDMVAKIAVQTSRSSGLAAVYVNLIGFEGCEFYFTRSKWNNMAFRDIHYCYPDGVAIGVRTGKGEIIVHPEADYRLKEDDDIIILAEDDSTIHFKGKAIVKPVDFEYEEKKGEKQKEKVLIVGWNNKSYTIITQYLDYILEGSEIIIALSDISDKIRETVGLIAKKNPGFSIKIMKMNMLNIKHLEKLSPESFNSIVILTANEVDQERADAATINKLLMIRESIRQKDRDNRTQIIAEVLNSDNLELVAKTGVHDAIISTKMVSKVLAQIAEEPDILYVFDELFKEEGSEIYLKPIDFYFKSKPETATFADLIWASQKRNEICIGYRLKSTKEDVESGFGVVINPSKKRPVNIEDVDSLIVIAEDEL